jgi:hypothetical protein
MQVERALPIVFKTNGRRPAPTAGSIPVRLRYLARDKSFAGMPVGGIGLAAAAVRAARHDNEMRGGRAMYPTITAPGPSRGVARD